ncbi:MAG: PD-(D/E)XK nuclease family protein [Muribaculaceae bacterium]|nr:PD-(D/E)XK nuclease family protein [Muribaculaceae bacterium]
MRKETDLINFFEEGTKILRYSNPSFNIFEMLGQSARELTHSAFIAGLLNPKGNHGMGTGFLDLFLKRFNVPDFEPASAEIIVEKDCGLEREEGGRHLGGRIDIFIQDKNENTIVIENKIYAADQDYQLERYWNSTNRKASVFYLTLDGRKPSRNSCGNIPDGFYNCISYSEIKDWLKDCINLKECGSDVSFAINHYMNTIDSLISDLELEKFITKSFKNLRLALAVANHADTIRENIRERFMNWFAEHLKETWRLSDIPAVFSEKKEKIFTVDYAGEKLDFCLDHNIYVRLYKDKDAEKCLSLDRYWHPYSANGSPYRAWKYLEIDGDTINFYDFNANAYLWLDKETMFKEKLNLELSQLLNEINI